MLAPDSLVGHDTAPADNVAAGQTPSSPMADDEKMRFDRVAIRDEIGEARRTPTAARTLGARHLGRLIYSLDDAAGVVEHHVAPYSAERPAE